MIFSVSPNPSNFLDFSLPYDLFCLLEPNLFSSSPPHLVIFYLSIPGPAYPCHLYFSPFQIKTLPSVNPSLLQSFLLQYPHLYTPPVTPASISSSSIPGPPCPCYLYFSPQTTTFTTIYPSLLQYFRLQHSRLHTPSSTPASNPPSPRPSRETASPGLTQ